ncbi:MAG: glycoside hydrolase family 3 N-terminal domain-containing protein, partial [Bacteroidota bacterium]
MRLFIYTVIAITMLSANSCNITPADFGSDDDGMMVIQGERKFIIGSYHLPKTDTPFKTLASRGYNYVRVANAREMDTAHENGLYTWVYTKSITLEKEVEDIERIGSLVNEFKEHPALLFWEIEDEPAFKWGSAEPRIPLEQMQRTYDFIKKLDAEHMVITNHGPVNLVSTIQQYNISTDLVACDVYPVIPHGIKPSYALYPDGLQGDLLNPYISQVGEYVDKMRQVVQDKMPVFMVLQGFSWEMLKEKSKQDSSMVLYPTYEESRFMAYNAIVHGANGILYWGTNYTPQPSPFMEDLARVTRELGAMQEVLAAPSAGLNIEKEYHELRYSVDTGVEIMTKEVGDKTYLLTVNSDKNPVKVTFSGLQGFKRANVLEEGRSLEIADGTFTEEYEPFGVHIYQLSTQQDLSDRERAADLTSHLTLEEKVLLLGGMDGMRTNAIPRFGIPSLNLVNGPNGVGDKPGTAFPVGVAMAATWNEELIHEIGVAIGREARAKRADIVLGPCVNIHRTPLGGRNFESYSEDPFLSGRMGVNFVNGVQSQRVATSLKHYALNNQESSRSSYDARLDERALREIYLPAFEMVVKEAQPMTVMAAYNLVRGEHCTQNRTLLTVILREEWGFDGFVMSDWDATHSVVPAVKAGLDLEMPGKPKFFNDQLVEAVKSGLVNEAEINAMVTNVLSLYFKIGVFDDKDSLPVGELDSPQHRALAARTAREAIVLLKNRERLLPLDEKEIKTIAVIGPNASVNRVGGGGSSEVRPFYSVTPLDGLKNRLGDRVDLFYLEGAAIEPPNMAVVESQYLLPPGAEAGEHGLKAEYFNNENMEGEPVVTRVDEMVDFDWGQGSPHEQ